MPAPNLGDLAVNDLFYVTFEGSLFSQVILNTFYYKCTALAPAPVPPTGRWTAYAKIWDAMTIAGGLKAKFLACIAPEYILNDVRLQVMDPQRMTFRRFVVGSNGTHADSTNTPNVAASLERRSAGADRHAVGRLQIAGVPVAAIAGGTLDPLYVGKLDDLGIQVAVNLTDDVGNVYTPVLAYKTLPPVVAWNSSPVIGCQGKDTVRTMHRRTVGLGI